MENKYRDMLVDIDVSLDEIIEMAILIKSEVYLISSIETEKTEDILADILEQIMELPSGLLNRLEDWKKENE